MYFATAGIEVAPIIPAAAAFVISFFCSMAGISGAFLLLPFQISVLGYYRPGVSATNQVFNMLACPAGVIRFAREGRLVAPLAGFIAIGTLPGVFVGAWARLTLLSKPENFQVFAALVLLYMAFRLAMKNFRKGGGKIEKPDSSARCRVLDCTFSEFSFSYRDRIYTARSIGIILLSMAVGVVGGIYGIGGGAIMSPLLVSWFGFPIHAIAGSCLFATFLTSIAGVAIFSLLSIWQAGAAPDWMLGLFLGLGGMGGMYFGAAMQKYISASILKIFLFLILAGLGIRYLTEYFM